MSTSENAAEATGQTRKPASFVHIVSFYPERWSDWEKFRKFWKTTYSFDFQTTKRLSGAGGHLYKVVHLRRLAQRLAPTLVEDEAELKQFGYSRAEQSKELAAVIEAIFCGLYSALDCTRFVLNSVYPNFRNMKKSTRRMFQNGHKEVLDQRVPERIRTAIKDTEPWYPELLRLRDELTHSDVGSCSRDHVTNSVFYMHTGLGTPSNALVIKDVFAKMDEHIRNVDAFVGVIFAQLNSTLVNTPTDQVCGFFEGRVYERTIAPQDAIDFNSGSCKSYVWFDKPDAPTCPFKDTCGAYRTVKDSAQSTHSD